MSRKFYYRFLPRADMMYNLNRIIQYGQTPHDALFEL